jgi:hypothetical protein
MLMYFDDKRVAWRKRWRCGLHMKQLDSVWLVYDDDDLGILGWRSGVQSRNRHYKSVFLLVDLKYDVNSLQ